MSIQSDLAIVKLSADDRFLRNEGLTDSFGVFNSDGGHAFMAWLIEQGTNKADFVAAAKAAKKQLANDRKADTDAVSADVID